MQWRLRKPDVLVTTYFEGTIAIYSLQSTNEFVEGSQGTAPTPLPDDPWVSPYDTVNVISKVAPKWLRRPVPGLFGYGGRFRSVSTFPLAQGKTQSSSLRLRHLTTEPTITERPKKFRVVSDGQNLSTFAQEKSSNEDGLDAERWNTFPSLFRADSREEFGFSKSKIAARVAPAMEKNEVNVTPTPAQRRYRLPGR